MCIILQWDKIVLDTSKDVFVEFFAPWCGHCKNLAPQYEELGIQLEVNDKIVITKCDVTKNDVPYDIKGYPTLVFYGAKTKDVPVEYVGERNLEAMLKFLQEQTSFPWRHPKEEL